MPAEHLEKLGSRLGPDEVKVWAENWPIFQVFLALSTQWRMMAITTTKAVKINYVGIEYSSLDVAARVHGLELNPETLKAFQAMEAAAGRILNKA